MADFYQSRAEQHVVIPSLGKLEKRVKNTIPYPAFQYIRSGAEDEWTLRENTRAFDDIQIIGRALTDKENPSLETEFMGHKLKTPVFFPPIASHALVHERAELDSAKGAYDAGALYSISTFATESPDDIAAAVGGDEFPRFFQLYMNTNWEFNKMLLTDAIKAGFTGVFLTTDATISGYREVTQTVQFTYPKPFPAYEKFAERLGTDGSGLSVAQMYQTAAQKIGPDDVKRIKEIVGPDIPVILKGVTTPDDVDRLIEAGVDGIYVTNHGGRQIDGSPATIKLLPAIAKAVNHRVPLLFDSGVRRGSHVFKALALGADLVGVGRPLLYAEALGGAQGVTDAINQISRELAIDMQLTGSMTIDDVKKAQLFTEKEGHFFH